MRRFGNQDLNDQNIYVLQMDQEQKRVSVRRSLLYAAGALVLHAAAGLLNQPSSRCFYVVFPYLFAFLPLIYALLGVLTYSGAAVRMSSRQYREGIRRIRRSLLGVFWLKVIGMVLDGVYLLRHFGEGNPGRELIYFLLHLPVIALIVLYGRYYDRTFADIQVEA